MHKYRGGGWFDSMKQKADQLKNDAIQKSKDMGLHDKAAAAHQAAMGHATTAKQMVDTAHSKAMEKGAEIHSQMKPHLDVASDHANDALMHAQNKNTDGFKSSMVSFAGSMTKAGSAGGNHIMNNTKVGDASLADHASAMSSKVSSSASDLHGKAMGWLSSLTAKKPPANQSVPGGEAASPFQGVPGGEAASPFEGGRRRRSRKARKSRKHPKKGKRSRTMKGRKDFTTKKGNKYYNRRGHRQTKNAKGKKKRPYKSRKVRRSRKR
jgi:hypothetical protein